MTILKSVKPLFPIFTSINDPNLSYFDIACKISYEST